MRFIVANGVSQPIDFVVGNTELPLNRSKQAEDRRAELEDYRQRSGKDRLPSLQAVNKFAGCLLALCRLFAGCNTMHSVATPDNTSEALLTKLLA